MEHTHTPTHTHARGRARLPRKLQPTAASQEGGRTKCLRSPTCGLLKVMPIFSFLFPYIFWMPALCLSLHQAPSEHQYLPRGHAASTHLLNIKWRPVPGPRDASKMWVRQRSRCWMFAVFRPIKVNALPEVWPWVPGTCMVTCPYNSCYNCLKKMSGGNGVFVFFFLFGWHWSLKTGDWIFCVDANSAIWFHSAEVCS